MKTIWKIVSPYTGIEEDAPASSAGGGNIAGIGVDHPDRPGSGEPGIDPKKKKKRHTLIDRNGKIDGRTKSYREHRKKLEAARQRRIENNKSQSSKFIENIKKKSLKFHSEGPPGSGKDVMGNIKARITSFGNKKLTRPHNKKAIKFPKAPMPDFKGSGALISSYDTAKPMAFDTAKPMADMSNKNLQASKKKKKK